MSMFNYTDFKHAIIVFFALSLIFLALVLPLQTLLPDFFDPMVPNFLINKSILTYLMEHANFFFSMIIPVGLFTIVLYLWRKR